MFVNGVDAIFSQDFTPSVPTSARLVNPEHQWRGQIFSAMVRNLFDSEHRTNTELAWSFPITGKLRGLVQWYKGYGESLIDYNYNMNRIGVGVLLSDWL